MFFSPGIVNLASVFYGAQEYDGTVLACGILNPRVYCTYVVSESLPKAVLPDKSRFGKGANSQISTSSHGDTAKPSDYESSKHNHTQLICRETASSISVDASISSHAVLSVSSVFVTALRERISLRMATVAILSLPSLGPQYVAFQWPVDRSASHIAILSQQ